jgi:RNA polymerase sigma factor (sigma-70 family)
MQVLLLQAEVGQQLEDFQKQSSDCCKHMSRKRDYPPWVIETAWRFFVDEYDRLISLCRKATVNSKITVAEAMSEIAIYLPRIISTYDESKNTALKTHIFTSAYWYIYKLKDKKRKSYRRLEKNALYDQNEQDSLECLVTTKKHSSNIDIDDIEYTDLIDEINHIFKSFDKLSYALLFMYYGLSMTFDEISLITKKPKNTIKNTINNTIENLKNTYGKYEDYEKFKYFSFDQKPKNSKLRKVVCLKCKRFLFTTDCDNITAICDCTKKDGISYKYVSYGVID